MKTRRYAPPGIVLDQTSLFIGNTLFLDPNATGGITRITALVSSPVPEPATMILLGTGLAGVAAKVRKPRKGRSDQT